ncbi:peptidoglycan-binding protein [Fortiea contorta]|uniref:peptidoglycan-binding protein n=1 Tax=Fortiea contorta TaxID=1892405 RepID=UPI00037DDFC8
MNPATPNSLQTAPVKQLILKPDSQGQDVQALQTQLQKLGYYNGAVDGQYGESTQLAVSKFQKAQGLVADGIAGEETRERLQSAIVAKTPVSAAATPTSQPSSQSKTSRVSLIWWSLLGLGLLGSAGAILYLYRRLTQNQYSQDVLSASAETETQTEQNSEISLNTESQSTQNSQLSVADGEGEVSQMIPLESTSRLSKLSVVDQLIQDLHSTDPSLRRKAIWDLGQQGDSRAIQPLLDLMMDVDSQQRSLILAAVGEIGTRTLKPMNRALAISLQDESPQVRQNAIRDLTRVYDMMSQISQMLCHALEDSDAEVQSTAKYALNQMNRIRTVPEQRSPSEGLPKD